MEVGLTEVKPDGKKENIQERRKTFRKKENIQERRQVGRKGRKEKL